MTEQREENSQNQRERRRDLGIFFLILPIAIACMFCVGQRAITLDSPWTVNANMKSGIDPNKDYLTQRSNGSFIEPISPDILTLPPWFNQLTPAGAGLSTVAPNSSPAPTQASTVVVTSAVTPAVTSAPPTVPSGGGGGGGGGVPKPTADLQITKTDGLAIYNPGNPISYIVVASNLSGTVNVNNATVKDIFPAALSGITWTCAGAGGGTCTAVGAGNINDSVNLPSGSSVTYNISATVSVSATGNLSNTATVIAPMGIKDPVAANNSATDTDTPVVNVDLQITKTDGVATYTAGSSVVYSIVVSNTGPASAVGATITDMFPAQVSSASWTCVAAGAGASCTGVGSGNISDVVNVPVGASLTYSVTATTYSSATGSMTNTATVSAPGGTTDPNLANNSASDTDTAAPSADLSITNDDASTDYVASGTKTYTIVVSNAGPSNATGATVTDAVTANMASFSWSCSTTGSATCGAGGITSISDTINIPVGDTVTYTINVTAIAGPAGNLTNTASVAVPVGYTDPAGGNNSASDGPAGLGDALFTSSGTTYGNIGTGQGLPVETITTGSSVILTLSSPVSVGSHAGYDLIYYEEPNATGILMDVVILQIGDGSNWYTVLNWGDGSADTNTSISIPLTGNLPTDCTSPNELDDCFIDGATPTFLFSSTGVEIDVDGLGIPAGSYPYFRIFATATGDLDGTVGIDGIEVVP